MYVNEMCNAIHISISGKKNLKAKNDPKKSASGAKENNVSQDSTHESTDHDWKNYINLETGGIVHNFIDYTHRQQMYQ